MLFNTEEKNMMVGALTAGGLQAVFDGYFGYRLAGGTNISATPTDPAYWFYAGLGSVWIPNVSSLISWFGVPYLLYYFGKRKGRAKLKQMGVGGLIYGFSEFISTTVYKATAVATGNLQPFRVVGVVR